MMDTINELMPLSHDWHKERLTQLKNLFPDLFSTEGKLNIDELKKVINPESIAETERFEFRWFGKSEAKRNAYTPSNATLIYDYKRSFNQNLQSEQNNLNQNLQNLQNFNNSENSVHAENSDSENIENYKYSNNSSADHIIIEGENLEVLKLLSTGYRDQVKCIYIDPPYNTGKDFVYSDNFTESQKPYWEHTGQTENGLKIDTNVDTHGRYHSQWLNMMYSRLLIARTLLREDGVIFISIDDNEVHHLRKLCDEVFGSENFVSEMVRENKTGSGHDAVYLAVEYDYVLFYAKDKTKLSVNKQILDVENDKKYQFEDEFLDTRGKFYLRDLDYKGSYSPSMDYGIVLPNGREIFAGGIFGRPNTWRWSKEKFAWGLKNNFIVFKEKKVYIKQYQFVDNEGNEMKRSIPFRSLIKFLNGEGSQEVGNLLGAAYFSFPKPVVFIKYLLNIVCQKNDLVLDFFGGSGTTGQAVMELNQEDGGNRKFILVQMPEATDPASEAYKAGYKKISDITIERNKRAAEKIKSELEVKEVKKEQSICIQKKLTNSNNSNNSINSGLSFKVFKLVKSNFPRVEWAPDNNQTETENIASLKLYIAKKEAQLITTFNHNDLLTEILLKNGFTLNYSIEPQPQFTKNTIVLVRDTFGKFSNAENIGSAKKMLICLDVNLEMDTVDYFKKMYYDNSTNYINSGFICLERALDTTKKFNLKHYLGDRFKAF